MSLDEIRQFIEADGGKFIIVEQGKPILVITSFEEYKKKVLEARRNPQKPERPPLPKELAEGELRLEDLPL